jgi:hypothetical protein
MAVSNDALFYGAIVIVVMMIVLGSITKQRIYNLMSIPALLVIGFLTYENAALMIFVIGMLLFQGWHALMRE